MARDASHSTHMQIQESAISVLQSSDDRLVAHHIARWVADVCNGGCKPVERAAHMEATLGSRQTSTVTSSDAMVVGNTQALMRYLLRLHAGTAVCASTAAADATRRAAKRAAQE